VRPAHDYHGLGSHPGHFAIVPSARTGGHGFQTPVQRVWTEIPIAQGMTEQSFAPSCCLLASHRIPNRFRQLAAASQRLSELFWHLPDCNDSASRWLLATLANNPGSPVSRRKQS
jgi:hypothetical protein